jgi:hypothetical protein
MTLEDLHSRLDWSLWLESRGREAPKEGDFLHNYQHVLLLGALYGTGVDEKGQMLPFSDEERSSKANEARSMLGDVWEQVVQVLQEKKWYAVEG